jgi:hypothetical protein
MHPPVRYAGIVHAVRAHPASGSAAILRAVRGITRPVRGITRPVRGITRSVGGIVGCGSLLELKTRS